MGMDDRPATKETLVPRSGLKKDVRRIMGITQEAIRILASRWFFQSLHLIDVAVS
jgi:hypothetical protein